LLFPKGLGDELATELFNRLAERFKVVAPVTPAPGQPLSKWLREVIDGLGFEKPVVVAEETLVGGLLGFALVDPGRVGGVVAICRDDADPASSVGMVQATQGLLVVAVDTAANLTDSAATATAEIARFIDDEC
jgi:hypothetical protein